jgi:prepilin-type N-terminal cleavage/methylation domain-containing protein
MSKFTRNAKGYTLVELVIVILVLGIVSSATAGVLVSLISSFDLSQNLNSVSLVGQRAITQLSDELREAVSAPDSLRPWVSANSQILRFFNNENYADSIRYYFSTVGSNLFLYRSYQGGSGQLVPFFSTHDVNSVRGDFFVDDSTTGFCQSGRIYVNLLVSRRLGSEPDSNSFSIEICVRNYKL